MQAYHDLLRHILSYGTPKSDRTGTGTVSIFGYQMRFILSEGFPVITTKRIHLKSIIHELLWIIRGETNIKYLTDNGVTIWNEWADENGELGRVYGAQWRKWKTENGFIDQLSEVIQTLKTNPNSRRMIVSAWNPSDIPSMALPPCHALFQFYVHENKLSLQLYQRSADVFLGLPFNITSYALLLSLVAQVCGMIPHEFIWTGGDVHIYTNHINQVQEQLKRTPYNLPTLHLNSNLNDINSFTYNDITISNYNYHPAIKADISV